MNQPAAGMPRAFLFELGVAAWHWWHACYPAAQIEKKSMTMSARRSKVVKADPRRSARFCIGEKMERVKPRMNVRWRRNGQEFTVLHANLIKADRWVVHCADANWNEHYLPEAELEEIS